MQSLQKGGGKSTLVPTPGIQLQSLGRPARPGHYTD